MYCNHAFSHLITEASFYLKTITQRDDGLHLVSTDDPAFNKSGYTNKFAVDIYVFVS